MRLEFKALLIFHPTIANAGVECLPIHGEDPRKKSQELKIKIHTLEDVMVRQL